MSKPYPPTAAMAQSLKHDATSVVLADLVKKCQSMCHSAEHALGHLPKDRESFLSTTLGDVLGQLELVLRAVGQEPGDAKRSEERKSFLRKLFQRSQVTETHVFDAPTFDVTRQGLQGNASTVSLAELLSFLALGRKTGVLWVDTPDENFMISLVHGSVSHAASDRTPEGLRLGEILVGLGYLTRRQLDRFIEQTKAEKEQVSGDYLVKNGMISQDELQIALKQQVQKLVHRVVHARIALFRFREGMEIVMDHRVSMDVTQLLLESARAQDETTNAELRKDATAHTWSSWQDSLSAEVVAATGTKEVAVIVREKDASTETPPAETSPDAPADGATPKSE